jgi:hypothetical protein
MRADRGEPPAQRYTGRLPGAVKDVFRVHRRGSHRAERSGQRPVLVADAPAQQRLVQMRMRFRRRRQQRPAGELNPARQLGLRVRAGLSARRGNGAADDEYVEWRATPVVRAGQEQRGNSHLCW